jgi:hypothetical protein
MQKRTIPWSLRDKLKVYVPINATLMGSGSTPRQYPINLPPWNSVSVQRNRKTG